MVINKPLINLPKNFNFEEKKLISEGIDSWFLLKELSDGDLVELAQTSLATQRNLKSLRSMSTFICDIDLSQSEAALLIHSGIPTIKALASLTPQELIHKIGRLERLLNTGRNPLIDIPKALSWIKNAKRANTKLTQ